MLMVHRLLRSRRSEKGQEILMGRPPRAMYRPEPRVLRTYSRDSLRKTVLMLAGVKQRNK
jgi:hypothetical protein